MGRGVESVESVAAGCIFGIGNIHHEILKTATLSTSIECAPINPMTFPSPPVLRVAVEPEVPSELPQLVDGLRLLHQADPCVEVLQQDTGEYVIVAAGELHLEVSCEIDVCVCVASCEIDVCVCV